MTKLQTLRPIWMPIARLIILVMTYQSGTLVADLMGRPYRGGYAWSLTLSIVTCVFMVLSFIEAAWVSRSPNKKLLAAAFTCALFVIYLGIDIGYTGGWAHPFRLLYFQLCVISAVWLPELAAFAVNSFRNRTQ